MPHEHENDNTLELRTRLQYHFDNVKLASKRVKSVDLNIEAAKRRALKKAETAKKTYHEHKLVVFVAEAALVVMTLGVTLVFRRRKKSS